MTTAAAFIPPNKSMAFSSGVVFMRPLSTIVDSTSTIVVGQNQQVLSNTRMALGKRTLDRLEELGWKQTDLCSCVSELEPQALNILIRRDSKKSKFAPQIAEALGLNLKYLMTGEGPRLLEKPNPEAPSWTKEQSTGYLKEKTTPAAIALANRIVRMDQMQSLPLKAIESIDVLLDTIEHGGSYATSPKGRDKYEHNQSALEAKAIRTPPPGDKDDPAAGQN